jgi:hypothetical protein
MAAILRQAQDKLSLESPPLMKVIMEVKEMLAQNKGLPHKQR